MQILGDALIGYTGFVGSNIQMQRPFDFLYSSKNIEEIKGGNFNLVVCAGAPGTKWLANQNPEQDRASIQRLMECLREIKCRKFILISTIDVYDPADGVDEDSKIETGKLKPYGRHRRMLEEFVEQNFDSLIIRLPAIFGHGLKKNIIFDLLNSQEIKIHPDSSLQFYWLKYLWGDINKALGQELRTLNIATEPITIKQIAQDIFSKTLPITDVPIAFYDMQSKYGQLWGMDKPYLYSKNGILKDLSTFKKTSLQ